MTNMDMVNQTMLVKTSYLRKSQLPFTPSFYYSSFANLAVNLFLTVNDKTIIITTTPNNVADIGRAKKIVKLPSDKIKDRLRLISIIGPNTKARMNGAGS